MSGGVWCWVTAAEFSENPYAPPAGQRPGGLGGQPPPALIEVVFRDRVGLSGIESGGLVEVFGEGFLGGLVVVPPVGPDESQGEFSLGRSPGGVDAGGVR